MPQKSVNYFIEDWEDYTETILILKKQINYNQHKKKRKRERAWFI